MPTNAGLALKRNPLTGLTDRMERFCQTYAATGVGTDAYKAGYNTATMSGSAISASASKLLKQTKILARIKSIVASTTTRKSVTVDGLTDELRTAYSIALDDRDAKTMAGITMHVAKLHKLTDQTDKGAPARDIIGVLQEVNKALITQRELMSLPPVETLDGESDTTNKPGKPSLSIAS